MYVDTSLIISKLCDIAQHTDHHVRDNTNYRAYESFGREPFQYAVGLIPPENPMLQDKDFIADRKDLVGAGRDFSAEAFKKARPYTISYFCSYLSIIEKNMLKEDKKFFMGGDLPTMADIYGIEKTYHVFPAYFTYIPTTVFYVINWAINGHKGAQPEVSRDTHPKVHTWLDAVNAHLSQAPAPEKIAWEQAREILLAPPKHEYAKFVHHDEKNTLGLQPGHQVSIVPVDTGKNHPQVGELVSLNDEQVCLRNKSKLVMHFPRIGYHVSRAE